MGRLNIWPWLRPLLILTVVVTIPPLLYWFGYVQTRVQDVRQQSHTTLSAVAANLKDRLEALQQVAASANNKIVVLTALADGNIDAQRHAKLLSEYLGNALGTKIKGTSECDDPSLPSANKPSTQPIDVDVNPVGGGLRLKINSTLKVRSCRALFLLPLELLVSWDLVETDFDGLLILDSRRQLLAQDRRLPVQPIAVPVPLRGLPAHFSTLSDNKDPANPKGSANAESANDEINASQVTSSLGRVFRPFDFGKDITLELAGSDYLVFVQPVHVTAASASLESSAANTRAEPFIVYVSALLEKERLRSEAIALSPQTLVVIGTLVALGLFSIPFLKLRFMTARERMRKRDVWWLGSSLLCATALGVLVVLESHAVGKLQDHLDRSLERFAQDIAAQAKIESTAAFEQIEQSADSLLQLPGSHQPDLAPSDKERSKQRGSVLSSMLEFKHPDFEAMFSIDLKGKQTHKWQPRTILTPNSDLSDRDYFRGALALNSAQGREDSNYFFDAVISRTTGSQVGMYATPFARPAATSQRADSSRIELGSNAIVTRREGVLVFSSPMRSISNAVVSRPFQFVVVDRRGAVTFHRARGPYTGERFFEAVKGGSALQAVAREGTRETIHACSSAVDKCSRGPQTFDYHGKAYRMTAKYVPAIQSTLVAYYDESEVNRLVARSFGAASIVALGIVLVILVGAALTMGWRGGEALDWAYSAPDRTGIYLLACGLCVSLMAALWIARNLLPPSGFAWYVLLTPAVIMIALGCGRTIPILQRLTDVFHITVSSTTLRSRRLTGLAYQGAAVLSIIALVAWPTVLIFDDALTLHASAYLNGAEREWRLNRALQLETLTNGAVSVDSDPGPPGCEGSENTNDIRCRTLNRVYALPRNHDALLGQYGKFGFYPTCASLLNSGECRFADDGGAPYRTPWSFTAGAAIQLANMGTSKQMLVQDLNSIAGATEPSRTSLLSWFGWTSFAPLGLVALVGVLCLLIGSIAKHVMGIGILHDIRLDESKGFAVAPNSRWLLLRPSMSLLKSIPEKHVSINLLASSVTPENLQPPAADTTLLIRHIHCRLHDPSWRAALVKLLRMDTSGCVVLTTDIDPLFYLTQRMRDVENRLSGLTITKDAAADARADKERSAYLAELTEWASALCDVRKIRETANDGAFHSPDHVNVRTLAKIRAECRASESLMAIGQRLLQRPDINSYRTEEIVDFVHDVAEPYYRSLWELCSRDEQLLLIQLAQEGLVNPRRMELVRQLARRGLVVIDPHLRLMSESFARFVCAAEPPERISQWEHSASGMSWSRFGTPLYALAAVVVAILLFTQQEALTSILGVVTVAGGALGSLRNFYAANVKPVGSTTQLA